MNRPMAEFLAEVDAVLRAHQEVMDEDARSQPVPLCLSADRSPSCAFFTFRVTGRPRSTARLWPPRSLFVVTYPNVHIERFSPWPAKSAFAVEPIAELPFDPTNTMDAYRGRLAALLQAYDDVVPAFWHQAPPLATPALQTAKANFSRRFDDVTHPAHRSAYTSLEPRFFAWLSE